MEKLILETSCEDEGKRLDIFVCETLPRFSRSAAQRLCDEGQALVDGRAAAKNHRIKAGQRIELFPPEPRELDAVAQEIPLDIVYEDECLLVVNKPKGMVVHPAPGNEDGTLVNGLLHHCGESLSGIGGVIRPGIVHRIDKDTSGLLVVAKTDLAHQGLSEQFQAHTLEREYNAVVYGNLKQDQGRIDAPIGRHPTDRKKKSVTEQNARQAATNYTVLERLRGFTYVSLRLETGRTHQIRVHMAYIGHPVAGDPLYGPKKVITRLNGQCLHARTLGFLHPLTGEWMRFESPLPPYFTGFLHAYGWMGDDRT